MCLQNNYEIIRFIQQADDFHIIMDSVAGKTLYECITQNSEIEKDTILCWIIQIAKQLSYVERSSSLSKYKYVLPFCIIIKQDQEISLLNLKTKANQKRLEKVISNPSISQFFPEDKSSCDIYSFGKTVQYIFACTKIVPKLTRKEEKQIRKIISKCLTQNSRKAYQSFEEILIDFSSLKKRKSPILIIVFIVLSILLGIVLMLKCLFWDNAAEHPESYLETGLTYFVDLSDYEKSEEMFEKAEKLPIAKYYEEMALYMQGESNLSEKEMEELLWNLEKEMDTDISYEQKYCLLKVYEKIQTESAMQNVVRLSEEILNSPDWYRNEKEIKSILEKQK